MDARGNSVKEPLPAHFMRLQSMCAHQRERILAAKAKILKEMEQ
jgi:hypothetical protein